MARNFISSTSRSWNPRVHVSAHVVLATMGILQIMPRPVAAGGEENENLKEQVDSTGWYYMHGKNPNANPNQQPPNGQHINSWDVSHITSLYHLFCKDGTVGDSTRRSTFNADLNSWSTARVTNMDSVFQYCGMFNGQIDNWDTGKVKSLKKSERPAGGTFCLHLCIQS